MEELLGKGKSSNSSGESTGQVESRAENNQRIDREIQQLNNEVPIGLTEDPLMWWKENEKRYPLVRNLCQASRSVVRLDSSSQRNVPRFSQPLSMHLYF